MIINDICTCGVCVGSTYMKCQSVAARQPFCMSTGMVVYIVTKQFPVLQISDILISFSSGGGIEMFCSIRHLFVKIPESIITVTLISRVGSSFGTFDAIRSPPVTKPTFGGVY